MIAKHPERWGYAYHNLSLAIIPFMIMMEAISGLGMPVGLLAEGAAARQRNESSGEEANRLLSAGQPEEAEAAYHEGLRLTGQK